MGWRCRCNRGCAAIRTPATFYVFRGKRGDLLKILWHDGLGMSLYAKRLERGRFIWPRPSDGMVAITAAQLGYMLEGKDWRNPLRTWRPEAAR
jgi:transposase